MQKYTAIWDTTINQITFRNITAKVSGSNCKYLDFISPNKMSYHMTCFFSFMLTTTTWHAHLTHDATTILVLNKSSFFGLQKQIYSTQASEMAKSLKRIKMEGALQLWFLGSNLHRSGAHVGEDFFSGSGILIITKSSIETLLHIGKAKKKYIVILKSFINHLLSTCDIPGRGIQYNKKRSSPLSEPHFHLFLVRSCKSTSKH